MKGVRPTLGELELAMDVLLWLYEQVSSVGQLRDEISHVRHALDEECESRL